MKKVTLLTLSILILGGLFLLLRTRPAVAPSGENAETTTLTPRSKATPSLPIAAETTPVKIVGREFSFEPRQVVVKAEENVSVTFENQGQAPHNFFIKEINKGTKLLRTGEEETLELGKLPAGTYIFYCTVPGHRSSGMEGQITVE